jgi:hypothetical protein
MTIIMKCLQVIIVVFSTQPCRLDVIYLYDLGRRKVLFTPGALSYRLTKYCSETFRVAMSRPRSTQYTQFPSKGLALPVTLLWRSIGVAANVLSPANLAVSKSLPYARQSLDS